MQLSTHVELFCATIAENFKNNAHSWRYLGQSIFNEMINEFQNMPDYNDRQLFQNNIFNSIDTSTYLLDENQKRRIKMADSMSISGKKFAISYFNIMQDDYAFNKEFGRKIARLYLHKLNLEIFSKWEKQQFAEYYDYTKQLDDMLSKYNIVYHPGMNFSEYSYKFITGEMAYSDDPVIFDVIGLFEQIKADYKLLDKLKNKQIEKPAKEKSKEKPAKEKSKEKPAKEKSKEKPAEQAKEKPAKEKSKEKPAEQAKEKPAKKPAEEVKEKKPKKAIIPKAVKNMVWDYHIGKENGIGKCFVCSNQIDSKHFECGHILAECNGGTAELDNLRPVCDLCNKSVGSKNMLDFKKQYFANK